MDALVELVLQQGAVVMDAPAAFAAALVIITAVMFVILRQMFGARLDTQRERIEFLGEQVKEYKEKLQGASPDQAAKQLHDLKSELDSAKSEIEMLVGWYQHISSQRKLTSEQTTILSEAISALPDDQKAGIEVASVNEPESQLFATQILELLRGCGCCTTQKNVETMLISTPDEVGVLIVVADETNPPPVGVALLDAFVSASIEVKIDQFETPVSGKECSLMVSYKPPFASGSKV